MSHPWQHAISDADMRLRLEALRASLSKQTTPELTDSKCILVVAEPMPRDGTEPDIGEARTVVVTALDAETGCSADDQGIKVRIRKQCRSRYPDQNIHCRDRRRIAHQGEINNLL